MAAEMRRGASQGSPAAHTDGVGIAGQTSQQLRLNQQPSLVDEIDALLCGLWPGRLRALFDPDNPKPLAIGIGEQIADQLGLDQTERRRLGRLLGRWCARVSYLKALRNPGAMRHGIDGAAVEPVSREHEIGARQRLYRHALSRDRRQAAREQERADAERAAAVAKQRRANGAKPVLRLGGRP